MYLILKDVQISLEKFTFDIDVKAFRKNGALNESLSFNGVDEVLGGNRKRKMQRTI